MEKENRRWKLLLNSMKRNENERESMYFSSSRDEIFEMFERPDGSLSCFKRDNKNQ